MLSVDWKKLLLTIFTFYALQPSFAKAMETSAAPAMKPIDSKPPTALSTKQTKLNKRLHDAIMNDDETAVKTALTSGAQIESINHMGWTPLMAAIHYHKNKDLIKILLASGAQIEAKNSLGNTPLMAAAACRCEDNYEWACDHSSICKLLIDHGAQIEERNNEGNTALILAASKGHPLKCKLLIELGSLIETKNNSGVTALYIAAANGHEEVCKLLVGLGAQINIQDLGNNTALGAAAYYGQEQVCKLLLDHKAQIEAKSDSGNTTLMWAALHKNRALCRTLITYPLFNPFLPEKEFQDSRQRIFTALCSLWRACPILPKDIRKQIFCRYDPELKQDFSNSAACGIYNHTKEDQAPFLPLQVVRLLVQNDTFNKEKTVAAIKAHHFTCITPLMLKAIPITTRKLEVCLNPNDLETNYGAEIEYTIKKRLGLLSWTEKCSIQ